MRFVKHSSLILAIVIVTSVWECYSYTGCKKIKPVESLPGHFQQAHRPHHVIATSECQNCEKTDKPWDWLRGRTTPTKVCFKVFGVTPEGYFDIDANCEMANPDLPHLNCDFDFSKYDTNVRMKGSITIIDTDVENYVVTHFCVFGKESIWYIASPFLKLKKGLKPKILEKIAGFGFDTKEAIEGVSPVYIKNTTIVPCNA